MEKVNKIINIIKNMDIKDKLRLGICFFQSAYTSTLYNKSHEFSILDKRLKKIDSEYLVSYINMRKYPIVLVTMAQITEMSKLEQNQIAMYLVNNV